MRKKAREYIEKPSAAKRAKLTTMELIWCDRMIKAQEKAEKAEKPKKPAGK